LSAHLRDAGRLMKRRRRTRARRDRTSPLARIRRRRRLALAGVAGDVVSFLLGRRFGQPFLDAHGSRSWIRREHVDRVERLFDRHGPKVVLLGRFVGILRALTPFVAGASRFPVRRLLPYTVIGALLWAAAFTLVGYGFSESFQSAGRNATRIALVGALVIGTILLARAIQTRPNSRGGN
jgi:membrane protein DedA with SNARE-associated domain